MSEDRDLSRRGFLKAALVGFAAVSGLIPDVPASPPSNLKPQERAKFPRDVLTSGELQKMHIRIYQTPRVQLYLSKGILDKFTAFKDAKEKKINGVVIALGGKRGLSWNAINAMPEEARLGYQAFYQSPEEYPEEYWEKLQAYWENQKKMMQENLGRKKENTDKSRDINEMLLEGLRNAEEKLELLNDRQKAIEYIKEKGPPIIGGAPAVGLASSVRKEALEKLLSDSNDLPPTQVERIKTLLSHPEYLDKFYLFVAVGEERTPDPKYSYPSPDWFEAIATRDPSSRYVFQKNEAQDERNSFGEPQSAPGFTIRHELSHYNPNERFDGKNIKSEYDADQAALDSIIDAWRKYKETGNSEGYGFVFVSSKGVTVTKSPNETIGVV